MSAQCQTSIIDSISVLKSITLRLALKSARVLCMGLVLLYQCLCMPVNRGYWRVFYWSAAVDSACTRLSVTSAYALMFMCLLYNKGFVGNNASEVQNYRTIRIQNKGKLSPTRPTSSLVGLWLDNPLEALICMPKLSQLISCKCVSHCNGVKDLWDQFETSLLQAV